MHKYFPLAGAICGLLVTMEACREIYLNGQLYSPETVQLIIGVALVGAAVYLQHEQTELNEGAYKQDAGDPPHKGRDRRPNA